MTTTANGNDGNDDEDQDQDQDQDDGRGSRRAWLALDGDIMDPSPTLRLRRRGLGRRYESLPHPLDAAGAMRVMSLRDGLLGPAG